MDGYAVGLSSVPEMCVLYMIIKDVLGTLSGDKTR